VVSPAVHVTTANSCKAHLALPSIRFSLQKVFDPAGTCRRSRRRRGGGVPNDANHETVADSGFLVSGEHRSIKYMVFVKNGYHSVCPVVRSRVG
jgi:hypothetical protein